MESAETYKWKTELGFSKVLLTHSTIFGRVVTDTNNIFKAVVKDNSTNIDVRSQTYGRKLTFGEQENVPKIRFIFYIRHHPDNL